MATVTRAKSTKERIVKPVRQIRVKHSTVRDEAVTALRKLGFGKRESERSVDDAIDEVGDADVSVVLRESFRNRADTKSETEPETESENGTVFIVHEVSPRLYRYLTISLFISVTIFAVLLSLVLGFLLVPLLLYPLITTGPLQLPARVVVWGWSNPVVGLLVMISLLGFTTTKNRAMFCAMCSKLWVRIAMTTLALASTFTLALVAANLLGVHLCP